MISDAVPASMMMMDPSYNFAYAGDDSEREENADSNGVVQGQYSYINAEGNEIIVRYKAGLGLWLLGLSSFGCRSSSSDSSRSSSTSTATSWDRTNLLGKTLKSDGIQGLYRGFTISAVG